MLVRTPLQKYRQKCKELQKMLVASQVMGTQAYYLVIASQKSSGFHLKCRSTLFKSGCLCISAVLGVVCRSLSCAFVVLDIP